MENKVAIVYAKVAIKNISLGQKELKTEYILKYLEAEMYSLMDFHTESEIINIARNL